MSLTRHANRIEGAESLEAIWQMTVETLRGAGIEHVIYLSTDPDRIETRLFTTLPELYEGLDPSLDPFLDHCCKSYDSTLTGIEFLPDHAYLSDEERGFVERAAKLGFRSGVALPMWIVGAPRHGGFNLGTALPRAEFEARILPRAEEFRAFCLIAHRRSVMVAASSSTDERLALLSPRESEILHLVAQGVSQKECARICGLSPYTVADYVKSAYRKLGLKNRVEAARLIAGAGPSLSR